MGPDLVRHSLSADTKQEVLQAYYADQAAISAGSWIPPKKRRSRAPVEHLTLREWIDRALELSQSALRPPRPSTLQKRREILANRVTQPVGAGAGNPDIGFLADMPLSDITKADCQRWFDALLVTYPESRDRTQKAYKELRSIFRTAVDRGIIEKNPCDIAGAAGRVSPKHADPLLKDGEIGVIIDEMPKQFRLITALMLAHGLRIGEALGLERSDLQFAPHTPPPYAPEWEVHVRQALVRVTKGGVGSMTMHPTKTPAGVRIVPVLGKYANLIPEHLALGVDAEIELPYWFSESDSGTRKFRLLTTSPRGGAVTDNSYRARLNRITTEQKLQPGIHPHSGRKWIITRLAEQGAHVREIAAIVGDSDLEVIMSVYMKVNSARPPELMKKVNSTISRN
ncbi:tyrosine recombinase XerC [Corynebacterium sp. HMSC14H10]|uniref:site-specific integrase n=1 Tax=Corynebacterium sp. HMSC14H10 TaxID=1581103 RepID=UPI0008D6212D|nr:tyrosine-type recombinase/integrase [Corynebacterium sp. HMSC14H10]OFU60010.1 hypothetical protein HMPREF3135_08895 [Corynebacterium sp. HMSC14H10]